APIYVFTDWYIKQATGGVTGTDMSYVNALVDVAKSYLGITSAVALVIASLLGAAVGKKILRKHFEKAGMIYIICHFKGLLTLSHTEK
ncbi:MptD family putative ECF transporter S component, partial [Enterococcus faecalis]|uniref:MptD family putative ECF transporter S component n=1 Tax=Enterococcus faecalis TaxID=1351 RepID=UPI003CC6A493